MVRFHGPSWPVITVGQRQGRNHLRQRQPVLKALCTVRFQGTRDSRPGFWRETTTGDQRLASWTRCRVARFGTRSTRQRPDQSFVDRTLPSDGSSQPTSPMDHPGRPRLTLTYSYSYSYSYSCSCSYSCSYSCSCSIRVACGCGSPTWWIASRIPRRLFPKPLSKSWIAAPIQRPRLQSPIDPK